MNTYRIRTRPIVWAAPEITHETLEQLLDVTIRDLTRTSDGNYQLDLTLRREGHYKAFNEIFIALQQLGYEAVEAQVSEWADQIVEGTVAGILSGGVVASPSENAEVMLLAAVIGGLAGAFAGSHVKKLKVTYEVVPAYPSGWTLKEIPAVSPGLSPHLSAG